jgi:glycosyltransferase involved in cell wall biosynthesis
MKVVHVITGLDQGGAESMLEKLLLEGQRQDPDVQQEVISLTDKGIVGRRIEKAGIKVTSLDLSISLRGVAAFFRLVGILRKAGRGITLQTWMYHADLIGSIAALLAGQRRIVWNIRQVGSSPEDLSRSARVFMKVLARLSRRVPMAIVCNTNVGVKVHRQLGYSTARFSVIPNGFDTNVFCPDESARGEIRSRWRLLDEHFVVGLVARVDPKKDLGNFVHMARLVSDVCPSVRFVLVGRGVPTDEALSVQIQSLGLESLFVLEEQANNVARIMNGLDVFCLSSRSEGFPNVLGEAMACMTPCVSTDCGDAAVLLGSRDHVAPIEDPVSLSRHVIEIARTSLGERREIGRKLRKRIESEFSISSVWPRYRDLYEVLT